MEDKVMTLSSGDYVIKYRTKAGEPCKGLIIDDDHIYCNKCGQRLGEMQKRCPCCKEEVSMVRDIRDYIGIMKEISEQTEEEMEFERTQAIEKQVRKYIFLMFPAVMVLFLLLLLILM